MEGFSFVNRARDITAGKAGVATPYRSMADPCYINSLLANTKQFKGDLKSGVMWFLRNSGYANDDMSGFPIRTKGKNGPHISMEDFTTNVLIPLFQINTGRMLNDRQTSNLVLFRHLVSNTLLPNTEIHAVPKFKMIFQSTEQKVASIGSVRSIPGGVSTTTRELIIDLTKYATGMSITSLDVLYTVDPDELATAVIERLLEINTTWCLTAAMLHGDYCSKQPLLSELIVFRNNNFQTHGHRGAIVTALQLENMLCGVINRTERHFVPTVHQALAAIKMPAQNTVMIIPSSVWREVIPMRQLCKITINVDTSNFVYSPLMGPDKQEFLMGRLVKEEAYIEAQGRHAANQVHGQNNSHYYEMAKGGVSGGMQDVECLGLILSDNGTDILPVIVMDDTPFSSEGNQSLAGTLQTDNVKRVFFTVGSCPVVYDTFMYSGFFDGSVTGDCSPREIAFRSPGVTYLIDHDGGTKEASVSLQQLHHLVNTPEMFDPVEAVARFVLFGNELLSRFNGVVSANLLLHPTWDLKCQEQTCIFETSPRVMLINTQHSDNTLAVGQDGLHVVRRACMFNASCLSMLHNEVVGCGSTLQYLAPETDPMKKFIVLLELALDDTSAAGLAMVQRIHDLATTDTPILPADVLTLVESHGAMLPFSDPVCQIHIIKSLPPALADPAWTGDRVVGVSLLNILRGGRGATVDVFKKIFPTLEYSILQFTPHGFTFRTKAYTAHENLCNRILYCCMLPVLTLHLAPLTTTGAAGAVVDYVDIPNTDSMIHQRNACFVNETSIAAVSVFEQINDPLATRSNIITPLWEVRQNNIHKIFKSHKQYIGFLINIHYTAVITHESLRNHFDKTYYSGWAYLCMRTQKFTGNGIAILPRKGAQFVIGNRFGVPLIQGETFAYTEQIYMCVAPGGLTAAGVYVPNILCTDIEGTGLILDYANENCILAFDSFNGFTPEGARSVGQVDSILPLLSRYNFENLSPAVLAAPDPFTGRFCECPTLLPHFGDTMHQLMQMRYPDQHNVTMFAAAVGAGDLWNTTPAFFRDADHTDFFSALKRTLPSEVSCGGVFNNHLGIMFVDNYVIGKNGDATMRVASERLTVADSKLNPRIMGEGLYRSHIYDGNEFNFTTKFSRYLVGRAVFR